MKHQRTFTCEVPGCENERRLEDLMCRSCWAQVPPAQQRAVWNYFKRDKGYLSESVEYQAARTAAIRSVVEMRERAARPVVTKQPSRPTRLLALSGTPLWFWCLLHAGKDIENRKWKTEHRGTIAVHASNTLSKKEFREEVDLINRILTKQGKNIKIPEFDQLIRGAIIGLIDIVDCVEQSESPWFFGPFGFIVTNPRPLSKPIECKGKLGFWPLPDEIARELMK